MDRPDLISRLDHLDFFKYVDAQDFDLVRSSLLDNIIEKKMFVIPSGGNFQNLDGRLFSFDMESLTEAGALSLFNSLAATLEKAGLKISGVEQIFDDNTGSSSGRPDYRFILNERTCNLGKVPLFPLFVRGFVTAKYLRFLNRVLRTNKIKERFYLMNDSASDTALGFLTPAQARFINSLMLNPNDKVYKPTFRNIIIRPAMQVIGVIIKVIFSKKAT